VLISFTRTYPIHERVNCSGRGENINSDNGVVKSCVSGSVDRP